MPIDRAAGADPVVHFVLFGGRHLGNTGDVDSPGAVATVRIGIPDNSIRTTKVPDVGEARQQIFADAGSSGNNPANFSG